MIVRWADRHSSGGPDEMAQVAATMTLAASEVGSSALTGEGSCRGRGDLARSPECPHGRIRTDRAVTFASLRQSLNVCTCVARSRRRLGETRSALCTEVRSGFLGGEASRRLGGRPLGIADTEE